MSRLTPEDLAQELIDQAWEAEHDVERVRLVLRALARYPDHADGYVLLANQVDDDLVAVRALYERGVAAGEWALGTSVFAKEAGSFWGLIQTRPYMRARHGLALTLWKLGERELAITHLEAMQRGGPAVRSTGLLSAASTARERASHAPGQGSASAMSDERYTTGQPLERGTTPCEGEATAEGRPAAPVTRGARQRPTA